MSNSPLVSYTKLSPNHSGKRKGIFAGDGAGNYGWQKPITREATAQIIYNLLEAAGMLEKLPDAK